jgi:hypothetical protein
VDSRNLDAHGRICELARNGTANAIRQVT